MFFSYAAVFYEQNLVRNGGNHKYNACKFWQELKALGVNQDEMLGAEGTRWMQRLEFAWQRYRGGQAPNI